MWFAIRSYDGWYLFICVEWQFLLMRTTTHTLLLAYLHRCWKDCLCLVGRDNSVQKPSSLLSSTITCVIIKVYRPTNIYVFDDDTHHTCIAHTHPANAMHNHSHTHATCIQRVGTACSPVFSGFAPSLSSTIPRRPSPSFFLTA